MILMICVFVCICVNVVLRLAREAVPWGTVRISGSQS